MRTLAAICFVFYLLPTFQKSFGQANKKPLQSRTTPGGLRPQISVASISGSGYMKVNYKSDDDKWTCENPINGSIAQTSGGVKITYSFGRGSTGNVIGSYTVRSVRTGARGKEESTMLWYADGTFTSGYSDPRPSSSTPANFEIRGITTYIGRYCDLPNPPNPTLYDIKIWGACGQSRINFQITERSTNRVISNVTFSNDVTAYCGLDDINNIKTNLGIH